MLAAEACGLGTVTGTLEPGKRADLIAVSGDPRTDLADLRDLELVLVSGRAMTQAGVDTMASSTASGEVFSVTSNRESWRRC